MGNVSKDQVFPLTVKDQMGETCTLASRPIRIVSLVPSQTELLFDLGVNKEVVVSPNFVPTRLIK